MNETTKTLAFLVVGAAALTAAYFIDRPKQAVNVADLVGESLNADVEVDAPKRLKIVKYDRQTGETIEFEVASIDGVWSIPSKQDYPADATQQMAAAANALIDRKILRVAAETAQAHDEFGVVDPLSASLESGAAGVGTHVTMTDADDKVLVDMVIGKRVKDADGQRYVRKASQDVVYIVQLDTDSLSTKFEDWIEDDLLKLSPFDIRRVFINDYSANLGFGMTAEGRIVPQVSWNRRGEFTLTYDNAEAKWNLADAKNYDPQKKEMVPAPLTEDEELNQDALTELRNGLDDLLIVDVARKPEGLSGDLKAGGDFLTNLPAPTAQARQQREEAFEDLVAKGFSPLQLKPGAEPEILSSEGEVVCTMRDGVEYVLRFGKLKIQTESAADAQDPAEGEAASGEPAAATDAADPVTGETPGETASAVADAAKEPTDEEGKNLHRYLFVMARFNEDIIEKPELKELPPLPEAGEQPADAAEGNQEQAKEEAAPAPAGGDEPAAADQPEATDETSPDAETGEPASDEPAPDEPAGEVAAATEEAKPDPKAEAENIAAERKAIEQENQQAEDRYQETVEGGKKRVAELNERFGDWYYVISNDVFKQIHLGRDQVIKKKEAKAKDAEESPSDVDNPLSGLPSLPVDGAAAQEPATEAQKPSAEAEQPSPESASEGASAAAGEQPQSGDSQ